MVSLQPVRPASLSHRFAQLCLPLLVLVSSLVATVPVALAQHANAITSMGDLLSLCGQPEPLQADMTNCAVSQSIPMNSIQEFEVEVGSNATFMLVVQLRSTFGDADLEVVGPNNATWSSSDRISEDFVNVSRLAMQDAPGIYRIRVIGYEQMSFYQLSIQTSSLTALPNLVADEQYVLWQIYKTCCVQDDYTNSSTCTKLAQATSPGHTPEQDMCNLAPNECDDDGHLVRLTLSGDSTGNFVCNGSFPWQFGNFSRLQGLDLSHNSIIAPISAMADTVTKLTTLQRLYMGNNLLNGTFDCRLTEMPSLQILSLSRNLLYGGLPSCLFTSTVLTQLDLSQNLFMGSLPPLPVASPMLYLDTSNNGMPDGPGNGPGIIGTIPRTITNAAGLQYLALQGNSLTGTIPTLPSDLNTLILSSNQLVGVLPPSLGADDSAALPSNLHTFNVSKNRLTGSLPAALPRVASLQTFDVSGNLLTAGLNTFWSAAYLVELNVSNNRFAQALPPSLATLTQLRSLDASSNRIIGNLTAFAARLPATTASGSSGSSLLEFDVSNNLLTGSLPAALAVMRMFHVPSQATAAQEYEEDSTDSLIIPSSFIVANNLLTGSFPPWLMSELAGTYDLTSSATVLLQVQVNGGSNAFSCPPPVTSASQLLAGLDYLQTLWNMTCQTGSGTSVPLTVALNYASFALPPPPAPPPWPPGQAPAAAGSWRPPPQSANATSGAVAASADAAKKKKKSSSTAAAAAGAAVGVAVLVAAGGGYWWWRCRKGKRVSGSGSAGSGGSGSRAARETALTFNSVYDIDGQQTFPRDTEAGHAPEVEWPKYR